MDLFLKNSELSTEQLLKTRFSSPENWQDWQGDVTLLNQLVESLRPKHPERLEEMSIEVLLLFLEKYPELAENLGKYIRTVLEGKKFSSILTDAGILSSGSFLSEVRSRLFSKILPMQPEKERLQYVLNQTFYKDDDAKWVKKIPDSQLERLLKLLSLEPILSKTQGNPVIQELIFALEVLTYRICGTALEQDVIKMVPELEGFDSPFIALQNEIQLLAKRLFASDKPYFSPEDVGFRQLMLMQKQCENYVSSAFQNSQKFGISMQVNQKLLRIRQQLARLRQLLEILQFEEKEKEVTNSLQIARLLIEINCQKNNLGNLVDESTQLISYEITQHTARTGEHYITESREEYHEMLRAAIGGGFIVAFLCIFKLKISKMVLSEFGFALLYGLNYAFGFICIYLLGGTLATKQPAMTAAALVKALKSGLQSSEPEQTKHSRFAELFARLFRSQFIAFVGNVFMAFPVAMLLIWSVDLYWNDNIAAQKWEKLIKDLHPLQSPAIFHASIAGIYLFLSGLIAGYIANRDKHHQIYYRIAEHPVLKMTLGKKSAENLSKWYEKKWAGIVSNFWFGMFLGSTWSVGQFLGLNLDIRHITFAAGNFAMALYGANFQVLFSTIFWSILGIGLIGFFNFLVSFTLSLGLAFRSRAIPAKELLPVARSIWYFFKSSPRAFFFP